MPEPAKFYGIAAPLPGPVDPSKAPLVLQFDVKLNAGLSCGGAYMKFLSHVPNFEGSKLRDDTPYSIMFGPDVCGGSTNKVHLIIQHMNQKSGKREEKHLRFPPTVPTDEVSHVYTAILFPENNTYSVLVDGEEKKGGSLFDDFTPAFIPPAEIDDPKDEKPADWVDDAKIPDPDAKKPEDWDEDAPEFIPDEEAEKPEGWLDDEPLEVEDPKAEKPEDWDDEEDGDWEPPMVPNPKCKDAPGCGTWKRPTMPNPEYKGKWTAPLVDNPAYKGKWKPRQIPNPAFFNDTEPLAHIGKIGAVAIEIWTMDENYFFDNVVVTDSVEQAAAIRESTWAPKHAKEYEDLEKKEDEEMKKSFVDQVNAPTFIGRLRQRVVLAIEAVFDSPLLMPYSDKLWYTRDLMNDYPFVVLGAVVALALAIVAPIAARFVGKNAAAVKVGEAKKKDITPADAKPSPSKKAAASNGKQQEEIQEEEEEEDASPTRAGVRRRARRD